MKVEEFQRQLVAQLRAELKSQSHQLRAELEKQQSELNRLSKVFKDLSGNVQAIAEVQKQLAAELSRISQHTKALDTKYGVQSQEMEKFWNELDELGRYTHDLGTLASWGRQAVMGGGG